MQRSAGPGYERHDGTRTGRVTRRVHVHLKHAAGSRYVRDRDLAVQDLAVQAEEDLPAGERIGIDVAVEVRHLQPVHEVGVRYP